MLKYIFLIFMFFGCSIFLLLGILFIKIINDKVRRCTLKITGKVINYEREYRYRHRSNRRGFYYYVYRPVVECYIDGEAVARTLNVGETSVNGEYPSEICRYGEEVEVFFNPDDYEEYYTLGEKTIKPVGIALVCIGVVSILFVSVVLGIPLVLMM